jgi:CBS domain-containing protein
MALTARDIMETQVITLSPSDPLSNVHRLFCDEEIHGAPVVDDEGRVLGIITSMDLLRAASDEHEAARGDPSYFRELFEISGPDWEEAPEGFLDRLRERVTSEFMTEEVACVGADATVSEIARTLRGNHIHRVLVVEDEILQGIITTFDLVGLLEKVSA